MHPYSLPEVVDALATLLAAHGSRVVTKDDNVKEGELAEVDGDIGGQVPVGADLRHGLVGDNTLSDSVNGTGVTVEGSNTLLPSAMTP